MGTNGRGTLASLVAEGTLDAELAALLWLLTQGGVPLLVAGSAPVEARARVARALLDAGPERTQTILGEDDPPTPERLTFLVREGHPFGCLVEGDDLAAVLDRLIHGPSRLPLDAARRLGLVLILEETPEGVRAVAVHYLRPSERDAQGHVQRRPPAVLATWDRETDSHEHFAWGIMPELGERIARAQADLEERQRDRAAFLESLVRDGLLDGSGYAERVSAFLAAESPPMPAPPPERAEPSPFHGGLADPHVH